MIYVGQSYNYYILDAKFITSRSQTFNIPNVSNPLLTDEEY